MWGFSKIGDPGPHRCHREAKIHACIHHHFRPVARVDYRTYCIHTAWGLDSWYLFMAYFVWNSTYELLNIICICVCLQIILHNIYIYVYSINNYIQYIYIYIHYIVYGWWCTYPSEKYEFVSWDGYSIPNRTASHKNRWFQTTNQICIW